MNEKGNKREREREREVRKQERKKQQLEEQHTEHGSEQRDKGGEGRHTHTQQQPTGDQFRVVFRTKARRAKSGTGRRDGKER